MGKSDESSLGKNLRSAEKRLTKGLIKWKLKRVGLPTPDEETMDKGSERIVDEAHKIMKRRAKSILEELKQAKQEFLNAYRDEEKNEKE
jgi:predicted thioredoxin/glutaredoxin